jgi:hypothetical protein
VRDDIRQFTAEDVRQRIESSFRAMPPAATELLGTLVADDDHLAVLVRWREDRSLHRVDFDLAELYDQVDADTVEQMVDEVLHGSIHLPTMFRVRCDESGITHWR